jgi:ferredoxin
MALIEKLGSAYQLLAEALAAPAPDWITQAGSEWPLYASVKDIAEQSSLPALGLACAMMECVRAESLDQRQARYWRLFASPELPLYEALALGYPLAAGTLVQNLHRIYKAAQLAVVGAELPDHASVELAFLSHLAAQEAVHGGDANQWRGIRRSFIQQHAGCWLPGLGYKLCQQDDPVYESIGRVLSAIFTVSDSPPRRRSMVAERRLPSVSITQACDLCGFCTQVCPANALVINETFRVTTLWLTAEICTGCGKCVGVCPSNTLKLVTDTALQSDGVLRISPRSVCTRCGQPTVSQAELDAIRARIGDAEWLSLCLTCRGNKMEITL